MTIDYKILTIIPARSGSKSIPRKNLRPLAGKPLIGWILEKAKKAKLTGRIIVSTDDQEIADVAKSYSVEVPFLRPQEISQDTSTHLEFILHALNWFSENENYRPDIVAFFAPTTPLLKTETIDKTIELLINSSEADSVRPVSKVNHHPYKMFRIGNEYLEPFFSKKITGFDEPWALPRQRFPEAYIGLGAGGVGWRKTYLELNSLFGRKIKYFILDPIEAFDINEPIDFLVAEALIQEGFKKQELI